LRDEPQDVGEEIFRDSNLGRLEGDVAAVAHDLRALVVESYDALGRAAHVGDYKADARIEFARMPFDLGDDPARLRPAPGLIGEIGVISPDFVWRSSNRPREQIADLLLQDAVGGQPDRIFDPLGFEKLIDLGICKPRVGPEIDGDCAVDVCRDVARAAAGFTFALVPVCLNSILLVLLGLVFHKFSPHSYPHVPAIGPADTTHGAADLAP
jgi:hypothetical protein